MTKKRVLASLKSLREVDEEVFRRRVADQLDLDPFYGAITDIELLKISEAGEETTLALSWILREDKPGAAAGSHAICRVSPKALLDFFKEVEQKLGYTRAQ